MLALALAPPAAANGGSGGNGGGGDGTGGAGGIDDPIGAGGAGSNGTATFGGGGGGGAGAVTGGAGGFNVSGNPGPGQGGTGGVHGSVGTGLPAGVSTGSIGGAGNNGAGASGGGGGGAGGYGAVVTGAGTAGTITGAVTGGNGGAGGSTVFDHGGSGGSGGIGLLFTSGTSPTTLVVNGTVQGGTGGAAGAGSAGAGAGVHGLGGFGIVGSNLHITNNGTIAGGLDGSGGFRSSAIAFAGGDNSLSFGNATSGITGGITIGGGTLTFAQPTDVTVANVIGGAGAVIKAGAGTVVLSGVNTYTGGTTINAGKLSIAADNNLGAASGGLTLDGGTLRVAGNVTTARTVTLNAGGGTVEIDAGRSLFVTSAGTITGDGGLTKTGAGTLAIQGTSDYRGATLVQAGRLVASSDTAFSANSDYTIAAGAVLEVSDVPGIFATVGSLSGAGAVEIGNGATLVTGATSRTATFAGSFSGNGSLAFTGAGTQIYTGTGTLGGGFSICACDTGQFIIRGGSLTFGDNIDISGGTVVVDQGGTLTTTNPGSGLVVFSNLRIDGVGSSVTTDIFLLQGLASNASLIISGGATLTVTLGAAVQADFGGSASALVTGAGSLWTIPNTFAIGPGSADPTSVTLAEGGELRITAGDLQIDTLGTLNLGNGGTAGLLTITAGAIVNDGAIVADFTDTSTLTYDISGVGTLTKRGSGVLTLTGTNSYTGGTTLAGGTVSIAADTNLGDVSGALTLNGGVLRVTGTALTQLARNIVFGAAGGGFDIAAAANTFTVTQSFSGTGSLSKAGSGTLLLTNTHSYSGATTVSGGTLRAGVAGAFSGASAFTVASGARLDLDGINQSIGSLAGGGTVTLGAGRLTTGSANSSTSFSGSITGTGGLTKTGTGTFTLTGTSSYSGATTVNAGKLVVNGSVANSVMTVNSGAELGGTGTVGGIVANASGTVAPGNSIGTLTVSGNVAFASGSTYQVEVNAAGQSDRIVASGIATLSGGTVAVLAENGNYAASTSYTILTANGGVSGRFASVSSNLAFLTPALGYDATNVTLTMTRNDTGFGPDGGGGGGGGGGGDGRSGGHYIASTRNQGFIAVAAERLGVGNPVYDALLSSTVAEARAGFDLLSGEAHAQAVSVMIDESRLVRDTILSRLRGPLLTQQGGQVAAAFSADLPGRKGAVLMAAPVPQPRYALWGEAFGSAGNSDADGNAASLSRRSGGALLGADVMLYDTPGSSLRVGVAGGYSQSRFDLDARFSTGKLESGHAALYAGARFGNLRLDAGLAYSWSESDIRRQVQIRGFGDSLRLQRPGAVAQGFAELGYGFAFNGFALEPFAQLALIRVSTDAGTEQGGAAALRVLSSDQTLGFTTLGLRAEAQLGTMPLFARAMLGWRHGFGELTPQAKTAFALGTTPARVFAAQIDREAVVAEAGLDWRISQATALGLTYSAAIGERSRDHALKGRVEMKF
ncbi:autotransporter domain-containing protein [Bosea sp. Tri-49]|uniref:autotransporter domain-containing protein n=4 Tax=Bosea TaxID=85413 RepID=UPI000F7DA263|nr:autotransporter domain-containing protein [Bosea sp. Tri-49]